MYVIIIEKSLSSNEPVNFRELLKIDLLNLILIKVNTLEGFRFAHFKKLLLPPPHPPKN